LRRSDASRRALRERYSAAKAATADQWAWVLELRRAEPLLLTEGAVKPWAFRRLMRQAHAALEAALEAQEALAVALGRTRVTPPALVAALKRYGPGDRWPARIEAYVEAWERENAGNTGPPREPPADDRSAAIRWIDEAGGLEIPRFFGRYIPPFDLRTRPYRHLSRHAPKAVRV
jgi:hypothetical protein